MFIAHRVGPLIEDRSIDFAGINVRDADSAMDGETDMHLSYRVTAWFEPDESDQSLLPRLPGVHTDHDEAGAGMVRPL